MRPSPWFPITTSPVRNGVYEVRDSVTGQTSKWFWQGEPAAGGQWSSVDRALFVTEPAHTLQWRGLTDEIWTTRAGEQLPVFMIDGEHAKNIVRMILRKQRELREGNILLAQPFSSAWERGFNPQAPRR